MTKENTVIKLATKDDRQKLIDFLYKPVIDNQFNLPLSKRDISIPERVDKKLENPDSFWIIAVNRGQIIGCISAEAKSDPETGFRSVMASTLALDPEYGSQLIGVSLGHASIDEAINGLKADHYFADSWEGNEPFKRAMIASGFDIHGYIDDPDKRPPGVRTILYKMNLNEYKDKLDPKFAKSLIPLTRE
jgi:hypothetical protein